MGEPACRQAGKKHNCTRHFNAILVLIIRQKKWGVLAPHSRRFLKLLENSYVS
jgi:hypothetical protein